MPAIDSIPQLLASSFPRSPHGGPPQSGEVLPGIRVHPLSEHEVEITDEQGGVAALAGWLHTVGFVVLHRDNHSLTAVPEDAAPRYTVDLQNPTSYYVRDRLNGYCLNPAHASREAAWEAAQEMNASPRAAAEAVIRHDWSHHSPAAPALRTIRRHGYRGTLMQSQALALYPAHKWEWWKGEDELLQVWEPNGLPYYRDPAAPLPLTRVRWGGEWWPVVSGVALRRSPQQFIPRFYTPCDVHGVALSICLLCGPHQAWQCTWSHCRSNAVTELEGRPLCERCTALALDVTGLL
ncbi:MULTISPECIES: hypothetical protein [unclassified Streptomyces]|uniref:hypothetical protein n=1 Tax=unclassified Streptomyces TaxID=2593676 RepID=UPI002DD8BCCD|nr:hypothetical protein [Streptomyces sp. NBC_01795]WSA97771.1 hypothetical protein OIE63_40505 [Streptomyces sp. NBC_01795]WSS46712.1 hypothetical protein OG220_39715 [Streptomyces sp. NBC_01187]WSS47071.1 hypothetical protein OG220_41910 [Streptomyces sp. NBC_01187]